MIQSKLCEFFKVLEPKELRWLRDYIASPYFNKNEDILSLCEYFIRIARRGFPEAALAKERIFQKVFPTAIYDERKLNYLASDLLKLGEQFLAQRQWEADAHQPALQGLKARAERNLDKSYQSLSRQVQKELETAKSKSLTHHFSRYQVALTMENYTAQRNLRSSFGDNLGKCAQAIDAYYLLRRLSLSCEMLNRTRLLGSQYQIINSDLLRQMATSVDQEEVPTLGVYLALLDMLESNSGNWQYLDNFYELFLKNAHHFEQSEQKALCYFAINFCIRQLTQAGKTKAADRLLAIYEEGLIRGFLIEDNKLSPWDFKNIIKLGFGLRRFEWVEQFLTDYLDKLPAEQRQDAQHFNLADLNYHRKDYNEALTHLNRVEFSDLYYNLGAKAMLLKIYFETNAEEAFLSLAASFSLFLKRNKLVSAKHKKAYLNFIKLTLAIHKKGNKRQTALETEIRSTPQLNARSWLLQMLAEKNVT